MPEPLTTLKCVNDKTRYIQTKVNLTKPNHLLATSTRIPSFVSVII